MSFVAKPMVSPAARRTGVMYYLRNLTRCGVTGRLTNKVFINEHTGLAVIAFDQAAANAAGAGVGQPLKV